jgi:hypothetical protein
LPIRSVATSPKKTMLMTASPSSAFTRSLYLEIAKAKLRRQNYVHEARRHPLEDDTRGWRSGTYMLCLSSEMHLPLQLLHNCTDRTLETTNSDWLQWHVLSSCT